MVLSNNSEISELVHAEPRYGMHGPSKWCLAPSEGIDVWLLFKRFIAVHRHELTCALQVQMRRRRWRTSATKGAANGLCADESCAKEDQGCDGGGIGGFDARIGMHAICF